MEGWEADALTAVTRYERHVRNVEENNRRTRVALYVNDLSDRGPLNLPHVEEWPLAAREWLLTPRRDHYQRYALMLFLTYNGTVPDLAEALVLHGDVQQGRLVEGDYDRHARDDVKRAKEAYIRGETLGRNHATFDQAEREGGFWPITYVHPDTRRRYVKSKDGQVFDRIIE